MLSSARRAKIDTQAMNWTLILELVPAPIGVFMMARAVLLARRRLRQPWGSSRNIGWMASFRLFMLGAALTGIAAGLALDATWLLLLSLAIGGEEVLESTLLLDVASRVAA